MIAAQVTFTPPALSTIRVVVAVVALALGGFAIGTTEFVTMGVLPDIADGVGVDIPSAGHVISVYALGVVVGAPVIAALSARLPRQALLVGLMTAFLAVRASAGYLSARRFGEVRVVRLWSDYAAATALLGLGAAWLPGALT